MANNLPNLAEKKASAISNIYICTKIGELIAREFESEIEIKKKNAEEEVRELISSNEIKKASKVVDEFFKNLPLPIRPEPPGIGRVDDENQPLYSYPDGTDAILKTKNTLEMDDREFEKLRLDVACHMMWKGVIKAPKEFLPMFYTQYFRKTGINTLKTYEESGVVKKVEIISAHDACSQCKEVAKKMYTIDEALTSPPLPVEGCTHEKGWCRCCYAPYIED